MPVVLLVLLFFSCISPYILRQAQLQRNIQTLHCLDIACMEHALQARNRAIHNYYLGIRENFIAATTTTKNSFNTEKASPKFIIDATDIPEVGKLNILLALQQLPIGNSDTYARLLQRVLTKAYCNGLASPSQIKGLVDSLITNYSHKGYHIEQLTDLFQLISKDDKKNYQILCKMLHGAEGDQTQAYPKLSRLLTTYSLSKSKEGCVQKIQFHYTDAIILHAILCNQRLIQWIIIERAEKTLENGKFLRCHIKKSELLANLSKQSKKEVEAVLRFDKSSSPLKSERSNF